MTLNISEVVLNDGSNLTNITNLSYNSIGNSSDSLLNSSSATLIISQVDPNWFYSASAQSAAAIVGLMGAFITTKLINHRSFITQLQREITEYNNKINYINGEIETKNTYITKFKHEVNTNLVDGFLSSIASEIDPDKPYSLDELYGMPQTHFDYQQYENISKSILAEKYNEDYLDNVRYQNNYQNIDEPVFKPIKDNKAEGAKYQKYQKYLEDVIEKKAEISFYRDLLIDKRRIISSEDQEIMSMRDYLAGLFVFSMTGIFLPLFMMLGSYESMMQYRNITYIFILGGWILIIGQLYFSVVNLLPKEKL